MIKTHALQRDRNFDDNPLAKSVALFLEITEMSINYLCIARKIHTLIVHLRLI